MTFEEFMLLAAALFVLALVAKAVTYGGRRDSITYSPFDELVVHTFALPIALIYTLAAVKLGELLFAGLGVAMIVGLLIYYFKEWEKAEFL